MYPVTQDFNDKMRVDERQTFGRIAIDYTDPFIDQSIQVVASEQGNVSYPLQTADAVTEPTEKWASLDGSWTLDGTYALAPETEEEAETLQVGWWGAQLAGDGGAFSSPYPTLAVQHASRPVHSLRVVGDSKREEYPVDFEIRLYDSTDTLLHTETVTGNADVAWSKALDASVNQVAKSVLEIHRWSHAGRQVKILEFFTSIQETYEGDDIVLIHLLEEREVSQGSLPIGNISANEIDIRLDNSNRKFDAGNTASPLYQLLKPNRRIRAWLGLDAENAESENPPTFTRASAAINPETGEQVGVNEPRFVAGPFEGKKALLVEEGTDNVLSAEDASFEGGTVGNWNPILATQSVVGTAWHGTKGLRVSPTSSNGRIQLRIDPGGLNLVALNDTITFSAYARLPSGDSSRITIGITVGGVGSFFATETVTSTGWTRISVTRTLDTFGTGVYVQLFGGEYGGVSYRDVIFDGIQLEKKPYATSFTDGTRSPEVTSIPTAGVCTPDNFHLEFWAYIGPAQREANQYREFLCFPRSIELGSAIGYRFYHAGTGVWVLQTRRDDNMSQLTQCADSAIPDGLHLFAVDITPAKASVRVDGLEVIARDNPYTPSGFAPVGYIGSNQDAVYQANTYFADLRISSIARSDQEIAAAYQSGQPFQRDEDTTYLLSFNGSIYPVERVWVPLGTFWSGDWRAQEDGLYAATTGRDRLDMLAQSTYSASQVAVGATMYDLAIAVLQDAGLKPEEYSVDEALQAYTVPYAWFEPQSHREALRKIAEASLSAVYCDRHGVIRIEPFTSAGGDSLLITPDDYYSKDNPAKWSEVANVIEVETQPLRPDTIQEVYRSNDPISIEAGQTLMLTAYYNEPPCIDAVASLEDAPAGCSITDATYYAWGVAVEVSSTSTGTFVLVVNARPLKVLNKERAVARDEASITEHGTLRYRFPDNPLVQTLSVAQTIADTLLTSFRESRRGLEMEWRGNPALLLGDRVTVTDKHEQNDYYVTRQELEYDGSLRARLTGRKVA